MPISYFRAEYGRYGANGLIIRRFMRVLSCGRVLTVDATRKTISLNKSFGAMAYATYVSNKEEFDIELESVMNNCQLITYSKWLPSV